MFSIINIVGLAVGMAGFAIFALTAGVKLNADKFHKNAENIYSIIQVQSTENKDEHHTAFTPAALMPALKSEFPEIEDAVRIIPAGKMTLRYKDDCFYENNILFVDSNFLTFFTFEMLIGNPTTALSNTNSIILSETAAKKYFGEQNPIGKILILGDSSQLTVTGITQNIHRTSSITFEFLISIESCESFYGTLNNWKKNNGSTFIRLRPDYNKKDLDDKLSAFINKYYDRNLLKSPQKLYLFSLLDFRLKSRHIESFMRNSHIIGVIVVFSLGFILLIIVSINFINLSIARYMYRTKEIGIRKVIGASKPQLVFQFLGESLLLSFIALPIAIFLFDFLNPIFTSYLGASSLSTMAPNSSFSLLQYPFLFKYVIATTVFVGVISGIYPALILSKFHPIKALAGNKQIGKRKKIGSKIMIVLQFTLSIIFIAFACILRNQFDQLLVSDFGYNRNNIASIQVSELSHAKRELLKTEILQNPDVFSITGSGNIPIFWFSKQNALIAGQEKTNSITMDYYAVDYNFIELLDLTIIRGRSFSKVMGDENSVVLNETAVEKFQFKNPIGKQLIVGDKTWTVVGIVKDYVFGDIEFGMAPAILCYEPEKINYLLFKYSSAASFNSIYNSLKNIHQTIYPNIPFNCVALDDYFNDNLALFKKISSFFTIIGIFAVLFSCLGLLGLTSYMVERRTKEIGIRKALGASVMSVSWTIIKDFLVLVIIANVLGLIVIYFSWNSVLQSGLMFMTEIKLSTYLFVIFISLITAIIAVTSQTWKAAVANPIESLRYE